VANALNKIHPTNTYVSLKKIVIDIHARKKLLIILLDAKMVFM